MTAPRSRQVRRRTAGFVVVALVGVAVVGLFAYLADRQVDAVLREDLEREAGARTAYLRGLIGRAYLSMGRPVERILDPDTWARLEPELQVALVGFPAFQGLVVWLPGGRVGCTAGEVDAGDLRPRPAGPEGGVRLHPQGAGRVLAAFTWSPVESRSGHPLVNAVLTFPGRAEHRRRLKRVTVSGALVLGAVIYMLAAVAVLMTRSQERQLNLEREKGLRLKAVGEAAGGIAHEVRNPLNAISLKLQYLERRLQRTGSPPETGDFLRIRSDLDRIRRVVDGFVHFARARDLELEEADLGELAAGVVERQAESLREAGITWSLEREGDLRGQVDRERMQEVLAILVRRAVDGMRPAGDGRLLISLTGERRRVCVRVEDTGGERSGEDASGDAAEGPGPRQGGLGLGMSMARTLVESHGGVLEERRTRSGGCSVRFLIPRRRF